MTVPVRFKAALSLTVTAEAQVRFGILPAPASVYGLDPELGEISVAIAHIGAVEVPVAVPSAFELVVPVDQTTVDGFLWTFPLHFETADEASDYIQGVVVATAFGAEGSIPHHVKFEAQMGPPALPRTHRLKLPGCSHPVLFRPLEKPPRSGTRVWVRAKLASYDVLRGGTTVHLLCLRGTAVDLAIAEREQRALERTGQADAAEAGFSEEARGEADDLSIRLASAGVLAGGLAGDEEEAEAVPGVGGETRGAVEAGEGTVVPLVAGEVTGEDERPPGVEDAPELLLGVEEAGALFSLGDGPDPAGDGAAGEETGAGAAGATELPEAEGAGQGEAGIEPLAAEDAPELLLGVEEAGALFSLGDGPDPAGDGAAGEETGAGAAGATELPEAEGAGQGEAGIEPLAAEDAPELLLGVEEGDGAPAPADGEEPAPEPARKAAARPKAAAKRRAAEPAASGGIPVEEPGPVLAQAGPEDR